jgi:hypothetical protein
MSATVAVANVEAAGRSQSQSELLAENGIYTLAYKQLLTRGIRWLLSHG